MNTNKLIVFLTSLLILSACGDDGPTVIPTGDNGGSYKPSGTSANSNKVDDIPEVARLEFPHVKNDGNSIVLVRSTNLGVTYSIEYDKAKRSQRWTCFTLDKTNSARSWNRNNWINYQDENEWVRKNLADYGYSDPFQPDPDLPVNAQTQLEEYKGCGYQRGHICASSDRLYSKDANEQTFYLSNIMPQSKNFNTGIWQDMEGYVNGNITSIWNSNSFRDVLYVCKGGTIDGNNIRTTTATGIIVPKYYFMALLCQKGTTFKALAFWAEHNNQYNKDNVANYVISVDELEAKTGIDFFCNLDDSIEEQVESASVTQILKDWKLN